MTPKLQMTRSLVPFKALSASPADDSIDNDPFLAHPFYDLNLSTGPTIHNNAANEAETLPGEIAPEDVCFFRALAINKYFWRHPMHRPRTLHSQTPLKGMHCQYILTLFCARRMTWHILKAIPAFRTALQCTSLALDPG